MDWFMGKGRRKDKDSPTPPAQEEIKRYLDDHCVRERVTDADFFKLVSLPNSLDCNEWIATHTISFFNHTNLMYGVVSEYCTAETCLSMTGPGKCNYRHYKNISDYRHFFWLDDKGKKIKISAPQYVDYVTSYIQKEISNESTFPTKFGHTFPSTFQATAKKIHKYLFHLLAHIYHSHYCDVVMLQIHGHLNSLFTHFMVFTLEFDLMDEKEVEILQDLSKALVKQLPDPNQNDGKENKDPASRDRVFLRSDNELHISQT